MYAKFICHFDDIRTFIKCADCHIIRFKQTPYLQ